MIQKLIKTPGFHYMIGVLFGLAAAFLEAFINQLTTGGFSIDGPWVALVPVAAYAGKALIEYLRGEQAAQLAPVVAAIVSVPQGTPIPPTVVPDASQVGTHPTTPPTGAA